MRFRQLLPGLCSIPLLFLASSAEAGNLLHWPWCKDHCCRQPEIVVHLCEEPSCGSRREEAVRRESAPAPQTYAPILESTPVYGYASPMMMAPMYVQPATYRPEAAYQSPACPPGCERRIETLEQDVRELSNRLREFEDEVIVLLKDQQQTLRELKNKLDQR